MTNDGNSIGGVAPRRSRLRYIVPLLLAVPFVGAAVLAVITISSHPKIVVGRESLATVTLPFGGGTIERVSAVGAPKQSLVPVHVVGNQILPTGKVAPGEKLTIEVTVKRPGWISWLSGSSEQIKLIETTPVTHLTSRFVTRAHGQPITLHFNAPVSVVAYGQLGAALKQQTLSTAQTTYNLREHADAGTITFATAARPWEELRPQRVTWFPAGAKATAVAIPAPGTSITPATEITLTFSKSVRKVLGAHLPPVSPTTEGAWHRLNSHTIRFVPTGYGYGLGAHVSVNLPSGVNLVGAKTVGTDPVGHWNVPSGSTKRLQELLAELGYLPVNFKPSGSPVAATILAQEAAAVDAPAGRFTWRYHHTPLQLRQLWSSSNWTVVTQGAVMAFEQDHGLPTDGVASPVVWKALIQAVVKGENSKFGYTFVHVSMALPQNIQVWHDGKVVVAGPANTGIPASPTAPGTYPVYIHIPVGTMSGTNPDGSKYHDTGIPWISYFNGGDALHGFIRSSYGSPQSLGCVEMPFAEAGKVYPYTPIGTLVNVVTN